MDLADVARLSRYLNRKPALRDIVAAIARSIGIEFPDGTKPQYMTAEALKAFVDATGGRIEGVGQYRG